MNLGVRLFAVAAILALFTGSADALTTNKCQTAKKKCTSKHVACLLNCYAKAATIGNFDTSCLLKCKRKLDGLQLSPPDATKGCIQKAQAKGNCLTSDETAAVSLKSDLFTKRVSGVLWPIGSANKCQSQKQKCVSKKATCLLGCHAKAGTTGALDPACILKCKRKFDGDQLSPPDPTKGCIQKAQAKGNCLTADETAAMETIVDAFVDEMICVLEPEAEILGIQCDRRLVFLTSTFSGGNLGGLTGADATCQTLASAAGLPGTFKAWLSSSTTSAAARLEHSTVPYRLIDGVKVADDWADLTDGTLDHPIDTPESSMGFAGSYVFTGTDASGNASTNMGTNFCADWTSSSSGSGPGEIGGTFYTDARWTLGAAFGACSSPLQYYCFEQPPCEASTGGFCWFGGAAGQSCDASCASAGRMYDPATATFAGSGGTIANCESIMNALSLGSGPVTSSPCGGGFVALGCYYDTVGPGRYHCASPPTNSSDSFGSVRRVCACY